MTLPYEANPSTSPPVLSSRVALVASASIVFVITTIVLSGSGWFAVSAVLLTDGFIVAACVFAAAGIGRWFLRWCKIEANLALMSSTAAGLGLGFFSLIALGLGLVGALNRETALLLLLIGLVAAAIDIAPVIRKINRGSAIKWLKQPAGWNWFWLVPVFFLAVGCVAASLMPGVLWKPFDPHPYDVVSYHLQVPREWYELGKIVPLKHNVFSFFPFNVEMQFLLLMHVMGGPWEAMYACQLMSLAYGVLMVIAVYGACGKESAVIAAALVSSVPWVVMLSSVAYVESALMLYTTLAIAWTLRAFSGTSQSCASREPSGSAAGSVDYSRDRKLSETLPAAEPLGSLLAHKSAVPAYILAGLSAGFACGVKLPAIPMLLVAIPLAGLASNVLSKRDQFSRRSLILGLIIFSLTGALITSPWLIRNYAWTGNPIFPLAMKTLGQAHFSSEQVERFITAHSPTASQQSFTSRIEVLWRDVLTHWQYGYVILPAGLLAAAFQWKDRATRFILIVLLINLVVWLGFTHLLARFFVVSIPLSAILIGRFEWKKRWIPLVVGLVLTATVFIAVSLILQLAPYRTEPRSAFFGVRNLSFMVPPELAEASAADRPVALVGDAGAFLYQVPMSRLRYRTVFDVPANIVDPIAAWLGPDAPDRSWLIVFNPMEVQRLSKTYRFIPGLPKDYSGAMDRPYVIERKVKSE